MRWNVYEWSTNRIIIMSKYDEIISSIISKLVKLKVKCESKAVTLCCSRFVVCAGISTTWICEYKFCLFKLQMLIS